MGRLSPSGGKPAQSRRRKAASGRNRAELSVKDQELNAVLDTIDYGILFMGPDLRAKLINRAFRRMWKIWMSSSARHARQCPTSSNYVRRNGSL